MRLTDVRLMCMLGYRTDRRVDIAHAIPTAFAVMFHIIQALQYAYRSFDK